MARSALHEDLIYVANDDSRLERRAVEIGLRQADFVTITSGLEESERVIVSDLSPAVEGMLLRVVEAPDLLQRLKAQAMGADTAR